MKGRFRQVVTWHRPFAGIGFNRKDTVEKACKLVEREEVLRTSVQWRFMHLGSVSGAIAAVMVCLLSSSYYGA
jgi:hypothetical protein